MAYPAPVSVSRQLPDVINIRTNLTLANFKSDGVDLAIRYGAGRWPGLRAVKLFDEELFPVCSPKFNGGVLPTDPAELLKLPLLRDANLPWARWFDLVGIKLREDVRGTSFTDANLLLQAAISCQGMLCRKSVAVEEITSGRLVKLFNQTLRTAFFAFHCAEDSETLPAFRLPRMAFERASDSDGL